MNQEHFALANFEGPLDFLLCLIRKEEINLYDVSIQELIQQFIQKLTLWKSDGIEKGADFISAAAYLVWLKSKSLLPDHAEPIDLEQLIEDPNFEIIHHLMEYCRFKRVAKELYLLQEKQQELYFRGIENVEGKKPLGLDHITLEQLSQVFENLKTRVPSFIAPLQEETWRVSDKITQIQQLLADQSPYPLMHLFPAEQSQLELIVIFLAVLELMKMGEVIVHASSSTKDLVISKKENKL